MISSALSRTGRPPLPAQARLALYIGTEADEFCALFAPKIGEIEVHYKTLVYDAFLAARKTDFDIIIVDQRGDRLATQLVLPVLSTLPKQPFIVVVAEPKDVGLYLRVPNVGRVVTAPLQPEQMFKIMGFPGAAPSRAVSDKASATTVEPQPVRFRGQGPHQPMQGMPERRQASAEVGSEPVDVGRRISAVKSSPNSLPQSKKSGFSVFALGMNFVSHAYKRSAFVLLAALFSAFSFYGALIVFFLFSSNWAAPLTLTKGHELVAKAEADFSQLKVGLDSVEQKLSEARLDKDVATHNAEEARVLIDYSASSITKQLDVNERIQKTAHSELASLDELIATFKSQFNGGSLGKSNDKLYKSRLIDKKAYLSNTLSMLEARQRVRGLQTDRNKLLQEIENQDSTRDLLHALKKKLAGKSSATLEASSAEHLDLVQQALQARSAFDVAQSQIKIADEKLVSLERSRALLQLQISELEVTPLVRAINERIDVLFVPYGNEKNIVSGSPLYSCALTIIWCSKAGVVGQRFPGESAGVHPFFGKPIRGIFVEVQLDDKNAATREIIHANHSPLFF